MFKCDVEINVINEDTGNELSKKFHMYCSFCEKLAYVNNLNFNSCKNIGDNKYCPFCLRNGFQDKNQNNILIFSFRAVIGYYYHRLYRCRPIKLWLSEIEDMIDNHQIVGLNYPALSYDPQTFLWFADFNQIGKSKSDFGELCQTAKLMFDVFKVNKHVYFCQETQVWEKYIKAIELFHTKRKRPPTRRMLIPSFRDSGARTEDNDFWDLTKNFVESNMAVK